MTTKTRKEKLLNAIANDVPADIIPTNREESYLSYIAGESKTYPETPRNRIERYYDAIAKNGVEEEVDELLGTWVFNESIIYNFMSPESMTNETYMWLIDFEVTLQESNGGLKSYSNVYFKRYPAKLGYGYGVTTEVYNNDVWVFEEFRKIKITNTSRLGTRQDSRESFVKFMTVNAKKVSEDFVFNYNGAITVS